MISCGSDGRLDVAVPVVVPLSATEESAAAELGRSVVGSRVRLHPLRKMRVPASKPNIMALAAGIGFAFGSGRIEFLCLR